MLLAQGVVCVQYFWVLVSYSRSVTKSWIPEFLEAVGNQKAQVKGRHRPLSFTIHQQILCLKGGGYFPRLQWGSLPQQLKRPPVAGAVLLSHTHTPWLALVVKQAPYKQVLQTP